MFVTLTRRYRRHDQTEPVLIAVDRIVMVCSKPKWEQLTGETDGSIVHVSSYDPEFFGQSRALTVWVDETVEVVSMRIAQVNHAYQVACDVLRGHRGSHAQS